MLLLRSNPLTAALQPRLHKIARIRERKLVAQLQQPQSMQLRVALGMLAPAISMPCCCDDPCNMKTH